MAVEAPGRGSNRLQRNTQLRREDYWHRGRARARCQRRVYRYESKVIGHVLPQRVTGLVAEELAQYQADALRLVKLAYPYLSRPGRRPRRWNARRSNWRNREGRTTRWTRCRRPSTGCAPW